MTGYTVHTGSNDKFAAGWDQIFSSDGKSKTKASKKATAEAKGKKKKSGKKGAKKKGKSGK